MKKVKKTIQKKYPKASSKEGKKKYTAYMKAQFEATFD